MDCRDYLGSSKEAAELRHSFGLAEKDAGIEEFVEKQLSSIDAALHQVVIEASIEADHFWEVAISSRDDYKGWENLCRIGTRVAFKNKSLSAEWFRNRYVTNPDKKKKDVFSTYIRKGKGFQYPLSRFEKEPKWVRDEVAATEKQYALLRERSAALNAMRRSVLAYKRLYEKGKSLREEE